MKLSRLIFSIFSLSSFAHAEIYTGAISSALGGTGRAGMKGTESVFLNPALVPLHQGYELTGYYRDGYIDTRQHRQAWGLGALDQGRDVWFPGSLHYFRTRDAGRTTAAADGELWHAAIGQAMNESFSFGVSGYRLTTDVTGDRDYEQWNFSIGTLYLVNDTLSFAYVVDNIAKPGSRVPRGLREDMRQSVAGSLALAQMVRIRMDISREERFNPDKRLKWMTGFESMTSEFFVMRIGYTRDELADSKIFTAGVGFNGPRLRLDYGLQKNVERTSGALHSVDLRLPF